MAAFLTEDAGVKVGACGCQGWGIGVVVIRGQVGYDVLPAAVIVDGTGWIEGYILLVMFM